MVSLLFLHICYQTLRANFVVLDIEIITTNHTKDYLKYNISTYLKILSVDFICKTKVYISLFVK